MSLFLKTLSEDTVESSLSEKNAKEHEEDYLKIRYKPGM